jgi:hypothetical protein
MTYPNSIELKKNMQDRFEDVLGRRENEKKENKTQKPMQVFGLMLVEIHVLISVFYFLTCIGFRVLRVK